MLAHSLNFIMYKIMYVDFKKHCDNTAQGYEFV